MRLAVLFFTLALTAGAVEPPFPEFRWVNPPEPGRFPHATHATFLSPSMGVDVGYMIYLPPGYGAASNGSGGAAAKRYPVVYYLHGGRPGSELKSAWVSDYVHAAVTAGDIPPVIYVMVNGGRVSHYNMPQFDSMGEDVFVRELIPHIDKTYRTIADRAGRGIEGFSQGGRGVTRIMFRHPELFSSAAPGGPGYATEKAVAESGGRENEELFFGRGYNTWDAAREYARNPRPKIEILIHVGTKGFNYEATLEYMGFLYALNIPCQRLIVPDAPHSARKIYEKAAAELLGFHAKNFQR